MISERVGLSHRKLLRLLAPQTSENPLYFGLASTNWTIYENALNQLVNTGFEMLVFSFGRGFKLKSSNASYVAGIKAMVAKAAAHGIEVGGYDRYLIGWTRNSNRDLPGSDAAGGAGACWASRWPYFLRAKVGNMINAAGLSMLEKDGPYSGYICKNASHVLHHRGEPYRVYMQVHGQGQFYKWLRSRGVFIVAPDAYFFQGSIKEGIGYNEIQFSLPRKEELVITRTTLFESTFIMPPTTGFSFVPISAYHVGGNSAAFWPPSANLHDYETAIAMHMSYGL